MRIGVDVQGGDFAPQAVLDGVKLFLTETDMAEATTLYLFGNEEVIRSYLAENGLEKFNLVVIPSEDDVEMGESPTRAIAKKRKSSIVQGIIYHQKGEIDAFLSAGNTGALLAGVMSTVKPIEGILRPCISSPMPKFNGKYGVLLDVGLNADCKPEYLEQFAILGSIYAKEVQHIENPKVALLNIGEEPEKGNLLTKATHQLLKNNPDINFVGNLEPNHLFCEHDADVIVTDGFTGNIVLKEAESIYKLIKQRKVNDDFFEIFNYENYGGTSILGIDATVLIGHGHSSPVAIKNLIIHADEIAKSHIRTKFIEYFKNA
jgi:glycerol-3-phosphate acyltransferase PlsX